MRKSTESNGCDRPREEPSATAEAKVEANRLAARRRFLLGGAGALPVIVTLGRGQALAASLEVCQSVGLGMGDGFTKDDQFTVSMYCRP